MTDVMSPEEFAKKWTGEPDPTDNRMTKFLVKEITRKLAGKIKQRDNAIRQSERDLMESAILHANAAADLLHQEIKVQRAKAEGLVEALREMIKTFESVPETAQSCFDEPPEPKTSWDYQAFQTLHYANETLTKFNNEET